MVLARRQIKGTVCLMSNRQNNYSMHTFVLAFEIKGNLNSNHPQWEELKSIDDLPYLSTEYADPEGLKEEQLIYNFKNFFNCKVDTMFKEYFKNYKYLGKEKYYRITCYDDKEGTRGKCYSLDLDYIMMRVIEDDPKVGFLIISATNTRYQQKDDIAKINQFGRRIYTPFKVKNFLKMESPYDIELTSEMKEEIPINDYNGQCHMTVIEQILRSFFGMTVSLNLRNQEGMNGEGTYIRRVLDDRMFVISNYSSDEVGKTLKDYAKRHDDKLLCEQSSCDKKNIYEVKKDIYKLIYVDKDDSSCQSYQMIDNLLDNSLYDRWVDWGTLYAITQHSMILMSSKTIPKYLISYFFTEYLEMILIVLTQRVRLLLYSEEAGNKAASEINTSELFALQTNYVIFKNKFMLPELSSQEQPIELYDIMQRNLYVNKQKEILDEQIESMYEIGQSYYNASLNLLVLGLSIITIITAFNDFRSIIESVLSWCFNFEQFNFLISIVLYIVVILCVIKYMFKGLGRFHKIVKDLIESVNSNKNR